MSTNEEMHLDVETRSTCDLTEAGAHQYFDDPTTDLWCAAYSFEDEEPTLWWPTMDCPARVRAHILAGGIITAWNAAFERLSFRRLLTLIYGWPAPVDGQFRCTMTEGMAMNLPGKLEKAAPALGLEIVKDAEGHRLMLQMCRPRKPRKDENPDALLWWDVEEKKERLGAYCLQDVRTEVAVGKRVARLVPSERELYFLDMKINDRGVYIDKALCEASREIVRLSTERLNYELRNTTQGGVTTVSATGQMVEWLERRGIVTESVDKEHIEDLLIRDDIQPDVRRALEIRQEGAKTSVAKIGAMLRRRQGDGRMRGNLQFCGAGQTCRWAARGAQLQNMTRPSLLKADDNEQFDEMIDTAIRIIHYGSPIWLELAYGAPLTLVSDCVRSMIVAPTGRELLSSDFSNIEGRMVAWLAGQEDKLDAFRAFDAATGPDLYLVAAAGIYGVPISEAKQHRQIGKVAELSLGYQGGPRAFAKMAKNYGVRIHKLYGPIWEMAEEGFKDTATEAWEERGKNSGINKEGWLAAEVIKLAWRAKNYRITAFWKEAEEAALAAMDSPGAITQAGHIKYRKAGSFLFCQLPGGRVMCYPYPRVKEQKTPWGSMKPQIRYKGVHPITKRWEDKAFYGGLAVENITQAAARDVMAEAMLRVDAAGYDVVLTVHDEIVSEVDEDFGSLEEYNALMLKQPTWCEGLPISVSGWRGKRYRKG